MKPLVAGSLILSLATAAACNGSTDAAEPASVAPAAEPGTALVLTDTTLSLPILAPAVAEPFTTATLSSRLMGSVTEVMAREGDRVAAGQILVRLDARDLAARHAQAEANIASADAMQGEAALTATRMRALYADSAAPKMQLDAAEAGLARAEAAARAARAVLDEIAAARDYATIRAPFAGVVTQRAVDAGDLAMPGTPLVTVEDHARLRIVATVTPDVARPLQRGMTVEARVEGERAMAVVEGIVPAAGRSLTLVNAIVDNRDGALAPGGVASLAIPGPPRTILLVPPHAVRTEGDLTGVIVRSGGTDRIRWITLGRNAGSAREVLAGLMPGDTIVVPARAGRE